jgi:hypothetical protein
MPSLRPLALFACLWAVATRALADPTPPSAGRARFYTEPDYRGECLVVEAGASIENLEFTRDARGRTFNERISSVRFEGPVRVAVFEHSQFRGNFTWLNRDTRDLTAFALGDRSRSHWNEAVSSLQVEALRKGLAPFVAWEPRDADRAVRAAYRTIFGRDPDATGIRFYTGRLIDAGWSEEQLRDALRRSPEFKERDIDAIIRRAFREILGREADAGGLAAYRRGLGRGMTEPELRAELLRSREGTEHQARETVTRAYRELLKREPDPAGLENYTAQLLRGSLDEKKLREVFRNGDEFKQLRGK